MNQIEADSVKGLAKPVVEALEKVTEGKCSECKGGTTVVAYVEDGEGKRSQIIDCPICNGTGKVKWKWEPKVGEWFLDKQDMVHVIGEVVYTSLSPGDTQPMCLFIVDEGRYITQEFSFDLIPILPWESTIKKVLRDNGYAIHLDDSYRCEIFDKKKSWVRAEGDCPQEAVMRATIALGKKLEEEIK